MSLPLSEVIYMLRDLLMVVLAVSCLSAGAQPKSSVEIGEATDCPHPHEGIVRFALTSNSEKADLYEWIGSTYRKVGTTRIGKPLVDRFLPGSFYQWNYWGPEVSHITRHPEGSDVSLSTPYALSPDGSWFAAGGLTAEVKRTQHHRNLSFCRPTRRRS